MKKGIIWAIVVIVVIALIGTGVYFISKKNAGGENEGVKIETIDDMKSLLDNVYAKLEDELPALDSAEIDVSDESQVTSFTGLKSNKDVDLLFVSLPLMSSQAYEVVMVKAKDGADIESMKQEMLDNVNMRKWICVTADKVYITNSGNLIFMVMADSIWGTPVYNSFKEQVENKIGKELEKSEDTDCELPPETTGDINFVMPPVEDGTNVEVPTEDSGNLINQGPAVMIVQ